MNFSDIYNTIFTWATTSGLKLILGLLGLWIGWKVVDKLLQTLHKFLQNQKVDITLTSFFNALTDISLKILLVVAFLSFVGIPMASFAAILASAGLALGLALQGSLSNFAGGVIILLLRPFNVSDYIETSSYQGTVEKISIFYTHILTPDNKEILVPNGALANGTLVNYSSKALRRVDLTFSVGYEANILQVKTILTEIINSDSKILKDTEPFVAVSELADNSVNFVVRVWAATEDYWDIHFNLIEKVKIRFDEENISIPYPQMDLHVKKYN
ncbi:mechanosensitive ion channel family protein [Clostridium sp.]|uniref:mechanosensitive ion channel family protein n=1 Tax=Clostridium sp. TaxID=1506 RepID=UPI002FC712AC